MLILSPTSLASKIIELLHYGPKEATELINDLQIKPLVPTKQGIYAMIRKMVRAEILVKHKRTVALNLAWLTRLQSFADRASHSYFTGHKKNAGNILALTEGERVRYDFKSIANADVFWDHLIYQLVAAHPKTPWLAYNPHCWFFIARPDQERALRDFITRRNGQYLVTVSGSTPLDKAIRKEFDRSSSQYEMRQKPLSQKNTYYFNCIGDFVIEAWIDQAIATRIKLIYRTATAITPPIISELKTMIDSHSAVRLVVSHNEKKAAKLRRSLSKQFVMLSS